MLIVLIQKSNIYACEMFEVEEQSEPCQSDAIVRHYGRYYTIFEFDVFHTSANAIESQHERLGFPKT